MLLFFLALTYLEVGLVSLTTVAVFAVCLLIQTFLDKKFANTNLKRMEVSDKRSRKINEIIGGIKIVKFNAWEKVMNNIIKKFRMKEGDLIFTSFNLYNFSQAVTALIPTVLGLVVFLLYEVFNDDQLEVSQIYELVTLFNATVVPIRYFIQGLMAKADAVAAAKRINELIQIEPIEPLGDNPNLNKGEIEIRNGCFNWEDPVYYKIFEKKEMKEELRTTYILKDVNLKINSGEFVAVVGKVGSGKSSLLLAMMDEMVRQSGDVRKNGDIAYISQEAFLQNDTILNNITFGKPYEEKKFNKILDICQMRPDLAILPGKELTEIGERGTNMSGGQKQRINIARAAYSDSDIILIDDALSALDAYVGKKVMDDVFIGNMGGKTRIMVTHYLHLLEEVDKVILVDKGEIKAFGTLEEVRKTEAFKIFSSSGEKKGEEEMGEDDGETEIHDIKNPIHSEEFKHESEELEIESRMKSILTEKGIIDENEKEDDKKENLAEIGKLMEEETRETGSVSLSYFGYYMKNAGWFLTFLCILFFATSAGGKIICDWWIGQWAENAYDMSKDNYMIVYGFLGIGTMIFLGFRAVALSAVSSIATTTIFKKTIWNIFRRPMSFFDTTPSGVVINRCTNDVDQLDFVIPLMNSYFLNMIFSYIGSLILAAIVSPIIIVFVILGILVISKSYVKYFRVAVDVKRIAQMSSAPLISIGSEFIEGAPIIRAYGKKKDMLERYQKKADLHHTSFFLDSALIVWIRIRIEFSLMVVIILTIFSIVADKELQLTTFSDPSTSGLLISYLLPLCTMSAYLMYPMLILFKAGVSIQRLYEYAKWKIHEKKFSKPLAPERWPSKGEIIVENLSVRYRKGLPLVLDGISFRINPGEKVAIIGRTGSGKSTTLLTFMRILEMAKDEDGNPLGHITIDGQRIDELGLHELRGNISIIPQDPYLFEGTLRFNIDPLNEYTDSQIVEVLEAVSVLDTIKAEDIINQRLADIKKKVKKELNKMDKKKKEDLIKGFENEEDYISSTLKVDVDPEIRRIKNQGVTLSDKLNLNIEQKGSNLSIGQRQLICIGRALIKNPKILLMDEATANIDQKTDAVIQNLIKNTLKNTTVVTIAHRLITIIQYDKVVILERGKKIEEGRPCNLLEIDDGYFTGLVSEGGKEFFEKMKIAANDMDVDPAALFAK